MIRTISIALSLVLVGCSSPKKVSYPMSGAVAPQGAFQPNANLYVCNNIKISNRPSASNTGKILYYSPMIVVRGIVLATAPANDVCMTSGFGPRSGRQHKGIDLQSRPAGTIYSAAPGTVLEASTQSGFGNQVLIDHGAGVYTRYAHLARFAPALRPGQRIGFGQPVGVMGRSGNATAVHLHYEILTGNYNTPKRSYALKANNPLDFPGWAGLNMASK